MIVFQQLLSIKPTIIFLFFSIIFLSAWSIGFARTTTIESDFNNKILALEKFIIDQSVIINEQNQALRSCYSRN